MTLHYTTINLTRTQDIARIKDDDDTVMTWDKDKLTRMLSNVIIVIKYYNT